MSKGFKLNSSVSYILISNSKQLKSNYDNANVTNQTLKFIKRVTKIRRTQNCSKTRRTGQRTQRTSAHRLPTADRCDDPSTCSARENQCA